MRKSLMIKYFKHPYNYDILIVDYSIQNISETREVED